MLTFLLPQSEDGLCTVAIRTLIMLILACCGTFAREQSADSGKQVYSNAANSVFLVYLNNASGSPTSLGTAFLVKPHLLVTNAHVAEAGNPVLVVGPVRVPLKVVRVDRVNDLATMSMEADLASAPLRLSTNIPQPGEQIFTIGNPEGLEKTISQGIISGLRKRDGRDLLQITSPISHGSSGGPVLNSSGEVVGVAVAFLGQGQNLNFAVPVAQVEALLESKTKAAYAPLRPEQATIHASELIQQRKSLQYSDDPNSEYQKITGEIEETIRAIITSSDSQSLHKAACFGVNTWDILDLSDAAAERLVQLKPNTENEALRAYVLYQRSRSAGLAALFSDEGSKEKANYLAEKDRYLSQASQAVQKLLPLAHGEPLILAEYILGDINNAQGNYLGAISFHLKAASEGLKVCDEDLTRQLLQNLISENASAGKMEEAEQWFTSYSRRYDPFPYEWDSEGDRRTRMNDQRSAASAYEKAAASPYYSYDYCYAAKAHFLESPSDDDGVLRAGKLCVDASTKNSNKQNDKYFSDALPIVYGGMANVLQRRGVYQSALEYAKESLRLKPDYAFSMDIEADAYFHQQQYLECESVENEAIRVSEGKYSYMQFRLGTCYFAEGKWALAENSFRIAAEADKTDATSAFNLALSMRRQGLENDAKIWFKEALSRRPDPELRAKILSALE